MKIKATVVIELKDLGILGFIKRAIIKNAMGEISKTTIENDMVIINIENTEVVKE